MTAKRNQNQNQEEVLRELISEASGVIKDMSKLLREIRHESSQARKILPGLDEKIMEQKIAARIDDKLDERFEHGVDEKLQEVFLYLDEMMQAVTEGTVTHFAQLISLVYKVLARMNKYNAHELKLSPMDLIAALEEAITLEKTNNRMYKFFNATTGNTRDGYRGK